MAGVCKVKRLLMLLYKTMFSNYLSQNPDDEKKYEYYLTLSYLAKKRTLPNVF